MAVNTRQRNELLEYVRAQRGVDFNEYKDATVHRRLNKRLQATSSDDYGQYLDLIRADPEEIDLLLETLFINVTSFFRDPDAWEVLEGQLRLLLEPEGNAPIRVWCAGVASGEEGYTVAMLLAELLGPDAFVSRVKIYATDLDEDALIPGRHGVYPSRQTEGIPAELREKYLVPAGDSASAFRSDLRRALIFGRHDLLQDAPISRLDLLVCRNTMMYFNREAQDRILARFHFALRPEGLLFQGKAELLLSRRHLFEPVDGGARIFRKVEPVTLRDRLSLLTQGSVEGGVNGPSVPQEVRLRDLAFDASPVPQLLLDPGGTLALANHSARQKLGVNRHDIGRPFQDLEISYRPVELRSLIQRAVSSGEVMRIEGVPRHLPNGSVMYLNIEIRALRDETGEPAAVTLSFMDVTAIHELYHALEQSRGDLETAYEELQSTNEELETTNEELQSTIEELETTNDELHSTNEELETMNEELQSTNAEMGAVNRELNARNEEYARLNAYMHSILDSVGTALVVLDEDSRVRMWNERSEELWGLRRNEVHGESILGLDIGLPVEQLAGDIRTCLRGDRTRGETAVEARDRLGRPIRCRVTCTPLVGPGDAINGTILITQIVATAELEAEHG